MDETEIREALDRHWAASDANDFDVEHDIYRDDAVLEYPQSGERIRGRRNIQASRVAQPNTKRFTVRRIVGTGDLWVTEFILTYDGQPSYTVSVMEFLDGKVARETQYFGDPFEPGPSRAHLVEQIGETDATIARSRVLDRAELPVDTAKLARFLIGKLLVRTLEEGVAGGRIVETEAYDIGDPAGHAYRGITPRNRVLFGERGHAYVYLAYGISFMLNVSSETSGVGAGVLIRAIEPTDGIAIMQRNRGTMQVRDLARGPGRLCAALAVDRRLDGIDLCQAGPLWLGTDGQAPDEIGVSKRIGITRAADSPLRFYVRGNRFVSGSRAFNESTCVVNGPV